MYAFAAAAQKDTEKMTVRVMYLQTYNNAGHVIFSLCGKDVREVDALNGNQQQHFSIPHTLSRLLEREDVERCEQEHKKDTVNGAQALAYQSGVSFRGKGGNISPVDLSTRVVGVKVVDR
jgi:hypothetical protein